MYTTKKEKGNPLPAVCRKTSIVVKNGCLALLALLVLHRAKLLASNQSILALGVAPRQVAGTPVPVFSPPVRMPGSVCNEALQDAKPTKHTQPFRGEGVFGKDADIRTHQALHEAKPSKCPKGDRDSKLEVCFQKQTFSTS